MIERSSFWRTQNVEPLNFSRTTNQSYYFTDYSSAAEGDIVNPLIKRLLKEQRNLTVAGRFLRIFFGPAFQRGQLLFYSIIDAENFGRNAVITHVLAGLRPMRNHI